MGAHYATPSLIQELGAIRSGGGRPVLTNAERVQVLREQALASKQTVSKARKQVWDRRAIVREFEKGEEVYMRKAGLNTKLSESWEGPYTVERKNSHLSYKLNTGDRTIPSVHIKFF